MTEFLGMPVNAIVDEMIIVSGMAAVVLRLLRLRQGPKRLYRVLLGSYWLVEMPILYLRVYEAAYSEFVVQSVRVLVFSGLFLTCRLLTGEGFWKILGAVILGDLFAGIPGILRMLTCMLFGISLPGLKAEGFRWDLKFIYLFYMALEYRIVRRWTGWYQARSGDFGTLWKAACFLYVIPPYLSAFSGLVMMKSETDLFYIGNAVVVLLEGIISLFLVRMERG